MNTQTTYNASQIKIMRDLLGDRGIETGQTTDRDVVSLAKHHGITRMVAITARSESATTSAVAPTTLRDIFDAIESIPAAVLLSNTNGPRGPYIVVSDVDSHDVFIIRRADHFGGWTVDGVRRFARAADVVTFVRARFTEPAVS